MQRLDIVIGRPLTVQENHWQVIHCAERGQWLTIYVSAPEQQRVRKLEGTKKQTVQNIFIIPSVALFNGLELHCFRRALGVFAQGRLVNHDNELDTTQTKAQTIYPVPVVQFGCADLLPCIPKQKCFVN